MTRKQYRAIVVAQKEAMSLSKTKLIHRIINFRSHNYVRYPERFTEIAKQLKSKSILFDYGGLWYFFQLEGNNWGQPNFRDSRGCITAKIQNDSEIPF